MMIRCGYLLRWAGPGEGGVRAARGEGGDEGVG